MSLSLSPFLFFSFPFLLFFFGGGEAPGSAPVIIPVLLFTYAATSTMGVSIVSINSVIFNINKIIHFFFFFFTKTSFSKQFKDVVSRSNRFNHQTDRMRSWDYIPPLFDKGDDPCYYAPPPPLFSLWVKIKKKKKNVLDFNKYAVNPWSFRGLRTTLNPHFWHGGWPMYIIIPSLFKFFYRLKFVTRMCYKIK